MLNKIKNIIYLLVAISIIWYVFYTMKGCSGQDREEVTPVTQETPMDLSKHDTIAVMNLTTEYLNLVRDKKYDAALDMLYILDKDEGLMHLTPEVRLQQKQAYTLFPVYEYEITRIIFWKESDCRLDYTITITDPSGNSNAAKMGCALRPVRIGQEWYLTIANRDTEYKNSEIKQ